ncbi:MgtC/SapB family protein [Hyphomicrobium sp.]|uniref:MgtC/SapB family protein n=1 Tax=Hyphomicrobium sp. TaxID=82 RepID=UPI002FDC8594
MLLEIGDIVLRLTAAVIVGIALGIDRDIERKPIGARTLALVSLGAAAIALATINVPGLYDNKDALSRVVQGLIQGVMAGIGFIGAGVILHKPDVDLVKGLTTAATVWVSAALGVGCGLGQWIVVGAATVLSLIVLIALKYVFSLRNIDID